MVGYTNCCCAIDMFGSLPITLSYTLTFIECFAAMCERSSHRVFMIMHYYGTLGLFDLCWPRRLSRTVRRFVFRDPLSRDDR